jgi:preprotein translocase subunit SecB
VPEAHVHPMMFIECPRLILPFARRVVADVTRDGGYPPLMLDNVDFATLYRQKLEQLRAEKQQQQTPLN